MKRRTTCALWIAPFMAAMPLVLAHCSGGDDSSTIGPGKKTSDASVQTGDDSSTTQPTGDDAGSGGPGDSGGSGPLTDSATQPPSGDASPEASAPPPVPVPEGGAPSDPGTVLCGGSACDVSQNYCCVEAVDGGSKKETCNSPNTPCGAGGLKLACNEAADCNGGVCCQAISGVAVAGSTTCMSGACPAGATFQVCRVDSECGGDAGSAAKRCVPQTCTNTNPARTLKIEACAEPTAQNPGGTLGFCVAQ
jgi:hypothetical protein